MRSSKSRSRSKSNRNRSNNNNLGNIVNRVFDSSGPEGKVRGTPQQIIEKYNQLARDAQLAGDRVATENFQQHAEHYLRMLGAAQKEMDAKREEQERQNRERQAERDRERAKRQEEESNGGGDQGQQPQADPSEVPQPDVIDTSEGDSGLVETPEASEPPKKKPTRTRKPKPKPEAKAEEAKAEPAQDAPSSPDTPEAAE